MIMKSGLRKIVLTAHIISSIGWFGAVAVFLALALVGMISRNRDLVSAAYLAMKLTAWFVIVPFAIVSLLIGIISSLGTKWGLFRHYWVLLKLVITLGATILLLVHTQPIDMLADIAAKATVLGTYPSGTQFQMIVTSGAALVVLIILTGLAVYKPRGLTSYGWRRQQEAYQDTSTTVDQAIE